MQTADVSRREQGLWAVDTVNPNAWPAAADYLKQTSADFCCVQEAKLMAGDVVNPAEQTMRVATWDASVTPCSVSMKGRPSAGVAVCARTHIGMTTPAAMKMASLLIPPGRLTFKNVSAVRKGGFHLGSIYLNSSHGLSKGKLDILQGTAVITMFLSCSWALGGDWQALHLVVRPRIPWSARRKHFHHMWAAS